MPVFIVIEVPGDMTTVPNLTGEAAREICRADNVADLANAIEAYGVRPAAVRHARRDPGCPTTAGPHMERFRKAAADELRGAGYDLDGYHPDTAREADDDKDEPNDRDATPLA